MLCLHNAWEVFLIILFFFPNLKLMSAFFHEKKKADYDYDYSYNLHLFYLM